jgi:hypothetical protein
MPMAWSCRLLSHKAAATAHFARSHFPVFYNQTVARKRWTVFRMRMYLMDGFSL